MRASLDFHFYATGFENCEDPCLVRDDENGGDPIIVGVLKRGSHHPEALRDLIFAANNFEQQNVAREAGDVTDRALADMIDAVPARLPLYAEQTRRDIVSAFRELQRRRRLTPTIG